VIILARLIIYILDQVYAFNILEPSCMQTTIALMCLLQYLHAAAASGGRCLGRLLFLLTMGVVLAPVLPHDVEIDGCFVDVHLHSLVILFLLLMPS
jgi:hypothetical protein